MSLASHVNEFIAAQLKPERLMDPLEIISLLDLTLLDLNANPLSLHGLCQKAAQYQPAAICVYPEQLAYFSNLSTVNKASVINFPEGCDSFEHLQEQIHLAKENKACEIDYVCDYKRYLQGRREDCLKACLAVIEYCHALDLKIKVIIETGAFSSIEQIYDISLALCHLGADFIKSSTGKITKGIDLFTAVAMMSACADADKQTGLKFSGGIKTKTQAQQLITLTETILERSVSKDWFRIGASSLFDELIA